MASRAAQMLTEEDDDRSGGQQSQQLTTLRPSIVEVQSPQQGTQEFEIVEADDNLQPIRQPQQQDNQSQEAGGSQDQGAADGQQQDEEQQDGQPRTWLRKPHADRRARSREARDRTYRELDALRTEVQDLRGRVAQYEPRFTEFDNSRVQQQISEVDREIGDQKRIANEARRKISEAMIAQDGDALAAALDERDNAIMQGQQLLVRKNVLTSGNPLGRDNLDGARQGQGQPQARPVVINPQDSRAPPPLTREARQMADDFAEQHDWIDMRSRLPDGRIRDPDSRTLAWIDAEVMSDGFRPDTPEYWDELASRGAELLPHRFGSSQPQERRTNGNGNGGTNGNGASRQQPRVQVQPERRGPMTGGNSDRAAPASGRTQVYLNAERKAALIQAGALESDGRSVANPDKFKRLMKSYHEFDLANGVARQ